MMMVTVQHSLYTLLQCEGAKPMCFDGRLRHWATNFSYDPPAGGELEK